MNISQEDADRLGELQQEIAERLDEFKRICNRAMTRSEYERFKYNTLGHIEPATFNGSEWVTTYSSLKSLESVAEQANSEAEDEGEYDDEKELEA